MFVKEQLMSVNVTAQFWAYNDLFLKAFLNTLLLKNISLVNHIRFCRSDPLYFKQLLFQARIFHYPLTETLET